MAMILPSLGHENVKGLGTPSVASAQSVTIDSQGAGDEDGVRDGEINGGGNWAICAGAMRDRSTHDIAFAHFFIVQPEEYLSHKSVLPVVCHLTTAHFGFAIHRASASSIIALVALCTTVLEMSPHK
jgi:hypothetical protein